MEARYRFAVRFRLEPEAEGVSVDPAEFETQLRYEAATPGEDDWLFFRDNLWRGELSDPEHFRRLAGEALGVSVASVEFRAFEADDEHLAALRAAIEVHGEEFAVDDPRTVLSSYLGSALERRSTDG